jgi:hypothetical protein
MRRAQRRKQNVDDSIVHAIYDPDEPLKVRGARVRG